MCLARSRITLPQRSQIGGSRARFGPLETVIQRRQVPAGALGADDPEPALPFVERQTPPDAQAGGPAVAVELAVAEGASAIHQSLALSRKSQAVRVNFRLAA